MKITPNAVIKPLHRLVAEHKDVTKNVIQLNAIISTIKADVCSVLQIYQQYSELWDKVGFNISEIR